MFIIQLLIRDIVNGYDVIFIVEDFYLFSY